MNCKAALLALPMILVAVSALADGEGDSVIIHSGEVAITQSEFDARIRKIPEYDRRTFLRSWNRVQEVLAQMMVKEQLALDAREAGFDKESDAVVAMALGAQDALADAWVMEYVKRLPTPDYKAMAHETYLSKPDSYMSPEIVDVTHLLVSTKDHTPEEALEQARSLLERAEANPETFDDLVMEFSGDSSLPHNQGHFVGVKRGDMVAPFENAAFAMREPGSFTGPVRTQYGYHIIRLDEYHESVRQPFEKIESRLVDQAKRQHFDRAKMSYMTSIGRQPADISEEGISEMLGRYFTEEEIAEMTTPGTGMGVGEDNAVSQ